MAKYVVKNKSAAAIFNVIISLVCIAAVTFYFLAPLWEVTISFTISAEMLKSTIGTTEESNVLTEEMTKELEDHPIRANLAFTLKTTTFLSSFSSDGEKIISDLIDYNLDGIVNQLSDTVKDLSKVAVKSAAKASLKEMLKDPESETEYQWKDEAVVNEQIDKVANALTEENATVSSVSDAAVTAISEVYKSETGEEISEEDQNKAREELEKILNEVADENGNLNAEQLISEFLAKTLSEKNGENNQTTDSSASVQYDTTKSNVASGNQSSERYKLTAYAAYASEPPAAGESGSESGSGENAGESSAAEANPDESTDAIAQLKTSLTNLINEKIGDKMGTITTIMKVIGGVVIFTLFTWAYIVLKILCKIGKKNPLVKLKLPIWLGWLPFTVLYLLPTLALKIIPSFVEGAASGALAGASFSFFTCGLFSAIAAAVLILLSFPYRALKTRQ